MNMHFDNSNSADKYKENVNYLLLTVHQSYIPTVTNIHSLFMHIFTTLTHLCAHVQFLCNGITLL